MTATFAPTTDRPRLFDDRPPRARRPAAPDRGRGQPDSDPFAPRSDPDAPERDPFTPRADPPAGGADARAPAADPAAPGHDLAGSNADPAHSSTDPAHDSRHAPRGEQPAGADAPHHGNTLDHLITGAWEELTAHRTVTCPVCHGHMAPRYGSGALPLGGRCRRCGSSLG
jgi:hypothetical protein